MSPHGLPVRVWVGEAALLDPPAIGTNARLRTPFGDLEPVYPLGARVLGTP